MIAGGKLLVLVERRDPHVMVHKAGPLPPPGIRRSKRHRIVAGKELVADRVAHGIFHVRVDDLPGAARIEIQVRTGLLLGFQRAGADGECVLKRVAVVDRIGGNVNLLHRVARAIEIEIEPHVEEVCLSA
jgi:hypothetical protein